MSDARIGPGIQVTSLGHGRFSVERGTERRLAYAVREGSTRWVFIDGDVFAITPDVETPGAATEMAGDLTAPMPARVLTVTAVAGQAVAAGDVLVTLEAMKMELPVRAPRAGIVKAVSCQTGSMVNAGDTLVELE